MKKNDNKKSIILFILFSIILIFCSYIFLNYTIIKNNNEFNKCYFIVLIASIILEMIFSIFLIKSKYKNWKIEKIFLYISIPLGMLYLLLIPIGLVPDEKSHFLRSYEISEGHLVSDRDEVGNGGRDLPIELVSSISNDTNYTYSQIFESFQEESGKTSFLIFGNTSLYSFICYLPQTIGIIVGKLLSLPILATAYLGRLVNLLTWIVIVYFSLKLIPCYKKTLAFVSLLPITMQEAASLSPDALTIAVSFALIAYVIYMIKLKVGKINKKEYIIMYCLAIVMSMCKIVYLPLCLLLFLIPTEKFKNKKDKYLKIGILAFIVILINIIWLIIASQYLVEFQAGVNSSEQVKYILSNPFRYIQTIIFTLIEKGDFVFGIFGRNLEWFNIELPYIFPLISLVILSIIIMKDSEAAEWNKLDKKLGSLGILVISVLLIFTSLYVQWTKVGNFVIEGIQGRYFIPLLLLIPMVLTEVTGKKKKKLKKEKECIEQYLFMFLAFQNIIALILIFNAHM